MPASKKTTSSKSAKSASKPKTAAAKTSAKSKAPARTAAPAKKPAAKTSAKSAPATKKPAARTSAAKTSAAKKPAAKKSADEFYGESNSLPFQINDLKDDGKRKKIIVAVAAGILLLLLLFFGVRGIARAVSSSGSGKGDAARQNTLALAQKYLDKGQYDKAMDLLNSLLISNPDDEEADKLLDEAIRQKKASDDAAAAQNIVVQPGDSSYNINIDTDELTAALREQNERSQQMINDLLEQQRQSQNAQKEEAAAEKKAAEELKKKEEAERKAKEEELAKKNAALKAKIAGINEKIMAGKADLNTGNVDSALNNFKNAVAQLPLSEGEPAFSASKYSEVASSLFEASQAEKDPAKRDKLGKAAIEYVNKALSVNPNDPVSHYILGMNYSSSNDWQKAAKEFEAAAKNDPSNYMYYYQLGRAQYRLKNYTAARSAFDTSIKYNSKFDLAYYNLGMTLKRLKLNKDALAAFRNAHSVNPQNSKAYLEEARILNDAYKDSNGAVNCYKKVIELDPVNVSALNECGVVYSNMGQYANAEACHRKAVSLLKPGDKDPVTYYNLALALYNQKKSSEAEKYAQLAYDQKDSVKAAKDKAVVVYNCALVEDSLGKDDKAIALYKEVLALDPDNAKTKTNLGVMFMAMTPPDADTALTFFLDAYKVEKSFELENNLGSAYLAKKDYQNAITHFQNALKKSPKDQTVRFNLAKCYAEAGDYDNAKTCYVDIINADSKNYDSYIELSKVFIALKDTASAKSYLDILRQKNPTYRKSEVDSLLAAIGN
ncbi:MAG: tetratricopeptide repeat protein [Treponema sp.]|nr:tetratricopeptide repeat protein [Treponema sp.]